MVGPSEDQSEHALYIILAERDFARDVYFDELTMVALYIFAFQR